MVIICKVVVWSFFLTPFLPDQVRELAALFYLSIGLYKAKTIIVCRMVSMAIRNKKSPPPTSGERPSQKPILKYV